MLGIGVTWNTFVVVLLALATVTTAVPSWCEKVMETIAQIGRTRTKFVWVTYTSVTAYNVCVMMGYNGCSNFAATWASVFALVLNLNPEEFREAIGITTGNMKREIALIDFYEDVLSKSHVRYEDLKASVVSVPMAKREFLNDTATVTFSYNMIHDNYTMPISHVLLNETHGHFRLGSISDESPDNQSVQISRSSYAAPGFKFDYQINQNPDLSDSDMVLMGEGFATHVVAAMDGGMTRGGQLLSQMIGIVEDNSSPDIYWRIIPESANFGDNWETLNLCDNLHDDL